MSNDAKSIKITGTNNRYLIKLANREKKEPTKRVFMNKHELSEKKLTFDIQLNYLQEIYNDSEFLFKEQLLMKQELEKKISNYKQQDIYKNLFDISNFIDFQSVIDKLLECKMKCYYCNCEMFILYDNVRETYQWSVDRIDNNKGHNKDNFVISCLSCNIKRRKRTIDKFLFSQNLNIVKSIT